MSDYTDYYQAPYLFGGGAGDYEPDDSGTADGSNLTDYATFCQDCHTTDMSGAPYNLSNTPIDWTTTGGEAGGDKHGINPATNSIVADLNEPHASAWGAANGLVLSCTDCHEPHGSPSDMLIRREVNGATVAAISTGADKDFDGLCSRCHQQSLWMIHHVIGGLADAPYNVDFVTTQCNDCHADGFGMGETSVCSHCHFHGGDDSWLLTAPTITHGNLFYTGRRTF